MVEPYLEHNGCCNPLPPHSALHTVLLKFLVTVALKIGFRICGCLTTSLLPDFDFPVILLNEDEALLTFEKSNGTCIPRFDAICPCRDILE